MVVDHPPAVFCFFPDGRKPTAAVRTTCAGQYIFSSDERAFFADPPHDETFITQNLQRLSVFPKAFLHCFLDRLDTARRTGREHLRCFLCISRKILVQIAFVPAVGRLFERCANRFFVLVHRLRESANGRDK